MINLDIFRVALQISINKINTKIRQYSKIILKICPGLQIF